MTSGDFFQAILLWFYEVKETKIKTKKKPCMDNLDVNHNKRDLHPCIALFHPQLLAQKEFQEQILEVTDSDKNKYDFGH